ncbi:MAG TPA: bifunctional methylenetetrahydrofolate dehydrogenase/methenyltetrahydrofolate cyclohydrolase FolD [Haliangiales bacterium]|nr:bifunctional methylenetetrahydrofolate dehydrogenase/methenyltetrahydrofolate cyclohydrolase FolD [Haliangiales bacterium]
MTARIIDGKAVAAEVRSRVTRASAELRAAGKVPGLAVVLVGEDPASVIYVRNKTAAARECGIEVHDHKLPATTGQAELLALVDRLNADPAVDGILVQLPLPKPLDAKRAIEAIDPAKDVDGIHPMSAGLLAAGTPRFVSCTPKGCMALLRSAGAEIAGARALVIGRSNLVGKPMAQLLLLADATVTVAHSKTRRLDEEVARADIVVAAAGKLEMVKGAWIKEGAYVIDVGTNRRPNGKLGGDVEFDVAVERAAAITPVPGGVGPMTIAMLLDNTVESARARSSGRQ